MPRQHPNQPFRPASWPFFYGWFILFASAAGIVFSAPGQTIGVSAFTEPLLESLAIDRTMITFAYMIGTAGSAFLLTGGGRLYDRFGARVVGAGAALLMGCVLFYLSQVDKLSAGLAALLGMEPGAWISFAILTPGFLLLRFSGQGMLTMVSRNMLMKWFDHRRGLANGIKAVVVPLSFSMAPLIFHGLIKEIGWSMTWFWMGTVSATGLLLFILCFFRDNPEACGLLPDGGAEPKPGDPRHDPSLDWTLAQARRTRTFWVYTMAIALHGLFFTALTFHVVSIFGGAGIGETKAFATFLPAAILTVITGFVAGWISDHIRLGYLLAVLLGGLSLSMTGIFLLGTGAGYPMIIAGNGISGGTFGLLMSMAWPRFFGRKHLGAISGYQMSWTVSFSALGPYLFSLSRRFSGDYRLSVAGCLVFLGILAWQGLKMTPPPRVPPDS